jgi:hypothetical protein
VNKRLMASVIAAALAAFIAHPARAVTATGVADTSRAAAVPRPALWAKAVETYESNKKLVPGRVIEKTEEVDDKGRAKSQEIFEISVVLGPDGKLRNEIVRSSKNGKDTTKETKKEAAERERKDKKEKGDSGSSSHSFSYSESPFDAKAQPKVRVTETNLRETVGGASCLRFDFSYPERRRPGSKEKPVTIKGIAWIDEGSGRPMKIQYTTEPLPSHVKVLVNTLIYDAESNGAWILRELIFDARGSFLFIDKRFHGDLLFSDHFVYLDPDSTDVERDSAN